MPTVVALTSFDHGGSRRRDAQFDVSEPTARELARAGLVRILQDNPITPVGTKSSASPAGPASRQKIAKKSRHGDTAEQTEA